MKTITLQTAVILAVNELLALGPFSAYEATVLIRARVGSDYDISDTDSLPSGYPNVPHSRVRDIVVELFDNGIFNANKSYMNTATSSYTIYNPVVATTPVSVPVATYVPTPVSNPLAKKIKAYLDSTGTATIKQIQSALKIKGLTCNDIAKLIPSSDILLMDSSVSKIQVKSS